MSHREALAVWMIQNSIATGHGDTFDDLLVELGGFVSSLRADAEGARWEADVLKRSRLGLSRQFKG